MTDLRSKRVRLSQPEPEAAAKVLAFFLRNQEHLAPWSPPRPASFYTEGHWKLALQKNREALEEGRSARFFVQTVESGALVGVCNLTDLVRGAFQSCHLGYSLDKDEQGRGLMSEALSLAIRYAFDELRLHRIEANYLPINERSASLLRRHGFTVNGYARDYLYIGGAWRDHVLTSLTNPDMPGLQ